MAKKQQTKKEEISTSHPLDFTEFNRIVLQELNKYLTSSNDNFRPRKYTMEQIRRFLANPENLERQIREVSQYLLSTSSHYLRLVFYFARMLTLDSVLVPTDTEKIDSGTFKNNYKKVVKYVDNYNIKHELGKILTVLMIEDVFYGYERTVGNSFMIQRLPSNYCKISSIEDGIFNFSFNFDYFRNANANIENFPPEFKTLQEEAQKTGQKWQELDADKSVCFKFRDDILFPLPPFSGAFEEILDLEDFKDLKKVKEKVDNFKILWQKIPMKDDAKSEKDFIIGLPSIKEFHKNIRSVVPEGIGVISTPMDLQDISFERKRNAETDNLILAEENLFNSAGVSSSLFNSNEKGALTLNKSVTVDESMILGLLTQFERFFKNRLKKWGFKLIFPPLTIYNREDMFSLYLQAAQNGFPKTFLAATLGYSTYDLVNLNNFENTYLEILDIMIPLKSSYVQSGSDEEGAPKKPDGKLGESGNKTREAGSNKNK